MDVVRHVLVIMLAACGRIAIDPLANEDSAVPADTAQPCESTVTDGLIGWWKFDESSGATVIDSAAGNDGTMIGGTSRVDGAVAFDGVDSQLAISGSVAYATVNQPFSVSVRLFISDWLNDVPDFFQMRSDSGSPLHFLSSSDPNWLGLSAGSSSTWLPTRTNVVPSTGMWHHGVLVYMGANPSELASFAFYLDGVVQPHDVASGYGGQTQESLFGAAAPTSVRNRLRGMLDDMRIYGRVLSATEIAELAACRP